jgi:hypothetical protein
MKPRRLEMPRLRFMRRNRFRQALTEIREVTGRNGHALAGVVALAVWPSGRLA